MELTTIHQDSLIIEDGLYLPLVKSFLENQNFEKTRKQYYYDLQYFAWYICRRFPEIRSIQQLTRQHIIRYKIFLESKSLSSATICRKIASLSSYLQFIAAEDLIQKDISYGVKRPKVQNLRHTAILNETQVRELLSAINTNTLSGKLHYAVCATLLGTGIRSGALRNIRRCDIYKEADQDILRITTKGGKVSEKLLLPEVVAAINGYVVALESEGTLVADTDFIFQAPPKRRRGTSGQPISPKEVSSIVVKYAKQIGCISTPSVKYSAHSCRSTFATQLLTQGADISDIQFELDHASMQTTSRYLKKLRTLENSPIKRLKYFSKDN